MPRGRGGNGSLGALASLYVAQNKLRGRVPREWGQAGYFAPLRELLLTSSGGGARRATLGFRIG